MKFNLGFLKSVKPFSLVHSGIFFSLKTRKIGDLRKVFAFIV